MNHIKTILIGFLSGVAALVLILSLPGSGSFVFDLIRNDLVDFLGTEPVPTPMPTFTSPDFWQKIASDMF